MSEEPKKHDLLDRILDLENIEKQGPTLKIVSDNMRAILACIAMLAACVFLYKHDPSYWFTKAVAVLLGAWTTFYAVMAAMQLFFIVGFTVFQWVFHIVRPEILSRYKDGFVWVFVMMSLFGVFGVIFLIISSVSRAR